VFTYVRAVLLATLGFISSTLSMLLGGFDMLLQALVVFMIVDFLSGWLVAAVFKSSNKTTTGRLSSAAGLKGIVKKAASLMVVIVAVHLDVLFGTNGITRDAAIIALALNELLSIIENMGIIGIKMPKPILDALEVLNKKA